MDLEPNQLDHAVGSLEDDWGFVKKLLDPDRDPVPIQLTEIAPLIRYLGEWMAGQIDGRET